MSIEITPLISRGRTDNITTSPAPASESEDALRNTRVGRKLLSAAQEFEAHLISSWWEEAEKDLDDRSGGALGSGLDGMKGVAMNSVAMGIVKAGGIGIARMIFHSLEPALRRKLEEETNSNQASQASETEPSQ
jgi:hypothetical protein